jgi:C4-type Zn-finger protein
MMGIAETFCEKCKGVNCLDVRAERLPAFPEVTETTIVCLVCGARTHVAYTNDALEAQIEAMRRLPVGPERTHAQDLYRAAFAEFQNVMRARVEGETIP